MGYKSMASFPQRPWNKWIHFSHKINPNSDRKYFNLKTKLIDKCKICEPVDENVSRVNEWEM